MNRKCKQNIGYIRGVKFHILDSKTINVYKPKDMELEYFKERCNSLVKYLIDEGLFEEKRCRVNILQSN